VVQIGLEFYIGLAILTWCLYYVYRKYDPAWLLICVITVHYLILSGIQLRFAGRLVIVMAVLCGLGIIYLLSVVDLVDTPGLSREQDVEFVGYGTESLKSLMTNSIDLYRGVSILFVVLLLFSPSLIFVPTLMNDFTHDQADIETAIEIRGHSEELDREYPENHVLAPWIKYRMYNYFVNGESKDEGLGRYSYVPLITTTNPSSNLDALKDEIGYFVLTDTVLDVSAGKTHSSMTAYLGTDNDRFEGLEHGQLIIVHEEADIAVFSVVPGATIEHGGFDRESVTLRTEVTVSGQTFIYTQEVDVDEKGVISATVPYPGKYTVSDKTITVSEADVRRGQTVAG
jgi:dolichyl-diphosphooligosaccharide--protein glycosyltransferase